MQRKSDGLGCVRGIVNAMIIMCLMVALGAFAYIVMTMI